MPYLMLWHGRTDREEEMNNWGEQGPVFGPFPFFHMTYNCEIAFNQECGHLLKIVDDLVYYDGMYYGDWSFFDEMDREHRCRLIHLILRRLIRRQTRTDQSAFLLPLLIMPRRQGPRPPLASAAAFAARKTPP